MENKKDNTDVLPVDGSIVVSKSKAGKILKEHKNKVVNGNVDAFVSLKDINKIYPNGIQAVYDFNIDIKEHDFIVLVGPSGCGKSTTLRMVAGLEDITSGNLYIGNKLSNYAPSKERDISMVFQSYALYPQMTVYDNIAFPLRVRKYEKEVISEVLKGWAQALKILETPKVFIEAFAEAKDRNLNYTTIQAYISTKLKISDYASKILLSYNIMDEADLERATKDGVVLKEKIKADYETAKTKENERIKALGYTMDDEYRLLNNGVVVKEKAKLTKEEIRNKVFEAAKILDLGPYLDRRPKELSGGQMQRVALGRAIVRNAKLFLMDEPLSNLDAKLRVQMRSEIVRIHEQIGATTIYVTHDQTEAMTMATKIAVMSKGWVQQIGEPHEIYSNPRNIFVATFIGSPAMNIIDGTYDKGKIKLNDGYTINLGKKFATVHDEFYKNKLADIERILNLDDFKKMHALKIVDDILFNNDYLEIDKYDKDIKEIVAMLKQRDEILGDKLEKILDPFVTEKAEALKAELEYVKQKTNVEKMNETLEIVKTIKDEHGVEALTILYEQLKSAESALNLSGEKSTPTFNEYVKSIQKAIEMVEASEEKGFDLIVSRLKSIDGSKVIAKESRKWVLLVRKPLLTFEKISSADIGKLHNAQVFNKNESKSGDTLYYKKPKNKDGKKKKAVKVNLNSVDVRFINNLYDVAMNLYEGFKEAVNGAHPIKLGVRPEHIHLDEEYTNPKKTTPFKVTSEVVELMGSELLVHTPWNGSEIIAKISTGTLVKPHTEINLTINAEKVLVFDVGSGDTIR